MSKTFLKYCCYCSNNVNLPQIPRSTCLLCHLEAVSSRFKIFVNGICRLGDVPSEKEQSKCFLAFIRQFYIRGNLMSTDQSVLLSSGLGRCMFVYQIPLRTCLSFEYNNLYIYPRKHVQILNFSHQRNNCTCLVMIKVGLLSVISGLSQATEAYMKHP